MLAVLKKLFFDFYDQNTRYCIIRDSAYLREELNGDGAIDILIHPEEIDDSRRMLIEAGFKRFMWLQGAEQRHQENWMGFDDQTGKLIMLHLYQDILIPGKGQDEFVFFWRDIAIRDRILFEGTRIYVVEPHLECVMLYIQLAQRVTMAEDDPQSWKTLCGIATLCGKIRKDRMTGLCQELFWGNGLMISELIMKMVMRDRNLTLKPPSANELTSLLTKVEHELKPTFYKVGSQEDSRQKGWNALNRGKTWNTGKKIASGEGISICFIGSDGSGKTTLSEDIEKWLSEWIPCQKFYLGRGDRHHPVAKRLTLPLRVVYRKAMEFGKAKEIPVLVPGTGMGQALNEKKLRSNNIKEMVQYPVKLKRAFGHMRFASHSLKTIESAEKYRKNGGVAIFDRYPQTQFEGIYDGPKISASYKDYLNHEIFRLMARQESKSLAKAVQISPSLVFRLLVPPEISMKRKPDHDYESIRKKSEITEKLVFQKSQDYAIDATQSYDKELLTVKRIIWESLSGLP